MTNTLDNLTDDQLDAGFARLLDAIDATPDLGPWVTFSTHELELPDGRRARVAVEKRDGCTRSRVLSVR